MFPGPGSSSKGVHGCGPTPLALKSWPAYAARVDALASLAICTGSYLLGSVTFGRWLARKRGVDLAEHGSGNVGATNVGRVLGKKAGYLVLLLDALKGFLPTAVAVHFFGADSASTAATGTAAVLGHLFPVWYRFRGGKGAATSVGVMLAALPLAGACALVVYLVLKRVTRRASVGSLAGSVAALTATLFWMPPPSWLSLLASILLVLIWLRHRDNLGRLLRGVEPPSP